MASRPLVISEYDPGWPDRFREIAATLRAAVGPDVIRIDHIGSTSVPGLDAKDVIDVQLTVGELRVADTWADDLVPGLKRRAAGHADHIPVGATGDLADWAKRYWSNSLDVHVHVREQGRQNQRYALLFRDFLRFDTGAAASYGAVKRSLAAMAPDDRDLYYEVKDPVCDLIMAGAEHWASRVRWSPPPSDA